MKEGPFCQQRWVRFCFMGWLNSRREEIPIWVSGTAAGAANAVVESKRTVLRVVNFMLCGYDQWQAWDW